MAKLNARSDFNAINTVSQFVEYFFFREDYQSVFCVQEQPMASRTGWQPLSRADFYEQLLDMQDGLSGSFYVSTMLIDLEEPINNRQASFAALQMIVLDDIGTKGVDLDDLELPPTYVIETSKGNYQVGYVFDTPLTDLAQAKQLVTGIYGLGIADGGGALVNKFVRLPWGINNKIRSGDLDNFPNRLISLDLKKRPTVDEVAETFGISFVTVEEDWYGTLECVDSVVEGLQRAGLIQGTKDDGILMHCPWGDQHSRGKSDLATYYPIGTVSHSSQRGYNCFHDHCSRKTGDDVARWLRSERAEPDRQVVVSSELELLLQSCIHEQANNMVHQYSFELQKFIQADPVSFFTSQNAWNIDTGETRGARAPVPVFKPLGKAWQEHRRKKTVMRTAYRPERPMLFDEGGEVLNEYQPPLHISKVSEPRTYLDHIDYLLPDKEARELFHSWIAFKLQNPGKRSYMYLMIAPGNDYDEDSTSFGIGRSVVGNILRQVFQGGVSFLTYETLVGKSHDWGDWREKNQLIVVNEIKDEGSTYRDGIRAYEKIKDAVDIYPAPVLINPKHKRLKEIMQYFNVLGFSNHVDAIRLPADDRRIYVAVNPIIKRSHSEYAEMHRIASGTDEQAIADVFHWYMDRDVSEFDNATPPESAQKLSMRSATETDVETVIRDLVDAFPGDIVHKHHLKMMSDALWKEECNPTEGLEYRILQREVNRLWKRLDKVVPKDRHGGRVDGKAVRVLRRPTLYTLKLKGGSHDNNLFTKQLNLNEKACRSTLDGSKVT